MIFGIVPIKFRFRGKLRRLALIYKCFLDNPGVGLHPVQIARQTGIGFVEVNSLLESTPEMFVRLPRRPDGLTRFRMTSTATARSPEEIEKFLITEARKETLILYAFSAMIILILLIVAILVTPAL